MDRKVTHQRINTKLVGGIPTPLKHMKVNWDDYSQLNGKIKNVPNHQPEKRWKDIRKSLLINKLLFLDFLHLSMIRVTTCEEQYIQHREQYSQENKILRREPTVIFRSFEPTVLGMGSLLREYTKTKSLPLGFFLAQYRSWNAVDGCKILHHRKDGKNPKNK